MFLISLERDEPFSGKKKNANGLHLSRDDGFLLANGLCRSRDDGNTFQNLYDDSIFTPRIALHVPILRFQSEKLFEIGLKIYCFQLREKNTIWEANAP